jgi:hypothetical protein
VIVTLTGPLAEHACVAAAASRRLRARFRTSALHGP